MYLSYVNIFRAVTHGISETAERGFDFILGSFSNQALVPRHDRVEAKGHR